MELTQRLECTQDLYGSQCERVCPEQIGFLGICGAKYPVKKGPNKIGRDPETCSIVLNMKSISRQHAVINVLNEKQFMLMDLDSINKTKVMDKTLDAYIPHPLKNSDLVQFGDVFGVFRLLEEESELPLTQAVDVPDTPVARTLGRRFVVPESPDVSDKDDSFIMPSQPKRSSLKASNNFIKTSGKTIAIQPVGQNKIDNVYWHSSKQSVSFNSDIDESGDNETLKSRVSDVKNEDSTKDDSDSIHTASTQMPNGHVDRPSIHELNTQVPEIHVQNTQMPDIHGLNTQVPDLSGLNTQMPHINYLNTQVPDISGLNTQMPDLSGMNTQMIDINNLNTQMPEMNVIEPVDSVDTNLPKEEDVPVETIYTADTQIPNLDKNMPSTSKGHVHKICDQENMEFNFSTKKDSDNEKVTEVNKLDESNDEILFDEIDDGNFDEILESQAILPPSPILITPKKEFNKEVAFPAVRARRKESECSTDCEDVDLLPSQVVKKPDDDLTDCEDDVDDKETKKIFEENTQIIGDEDFEVSISNIKVNDKKSNKEVKKDVEVDNDINFNEIATQVITVKDVSKDEEDDDLDCTQIVRVIGKPKEDDFNDKPTQVIGPVEDDFNDKPTQVIEVIDKPVEDDFNDVPTQVIVANEEFSEEISPFKVPYSAFVKKKTPKSTKKTTEATTQSGKGQNYYDDTQDIFEDLCSQKNIIVDENKSEASDGEEKAAESVEILNSQQVRDIIGVAPLTRVPSDASDGDVTPKKVKPFKLMMTELPNSQEIKTTVSLTSKIVTSDSSSDSEIEQNSEQFSTTFVKKRRKVDAKMNLAKKFDADALPTRIITRVRKPTAKIQDSITTKMSKSILVPKFLTEQDDGVDKDIIIENITRLKSKKKKSPEFKKEESKGKRSSREIKKEIKGKEDKNTRSSNSKRDSKELPQNTDTKQKEPIIEVTDKRRNRSKKKSNEHIESIETIDKKKTRKRKSDDIDKAKEPIEIIDKKTKSDTDKEINEIPKRRSKEAASKSETKSKATKPETEKKSEETKRRQCVTPMPTIDLTEPRPTRSRNKKNDEPKSEPKSSRRKKVGDKIDNLENEPTENSKKETSTRRERKSKKDTTLLTKQNSVAKIDLTIDKESNTDNSRNKMQKEENTDKSRKKVDKEENTEVRRSNRQKKQVTEKELKSILKNRDQSTIYNLSSQSSEQSPTSLKRPASNELGNAKKMRGDISLRSKPKNHCVLLTAFPCEEVKNKLEKLGARIVTDVYKCTVVLTLQLKRTFKLLCAVGLGRPIVGPSWVQACADTNMIVDPWRYLLEDVEAERRFHFSLRDTLRAPRGFLRGLHVSATPGVMPAPPEMQAIVECSGGKWEAGGNSWVCITTPSDRALWPALRQKGATLATPELLLSGVLTQTLDIGKYAVTG